MKGAGTQRRQKREALEQAKQMARDKALLDLPPEPPTRQQRRKTARHMEKAKPSLAQFEKKATSKRRRKLSNNEQRQYRQIKEFIRANS